MHIIPAVVGSLGDAPNPWISTSYVSDNASDIWAATKQHLEVTGLSLLFGLLLSVPAAVLVHGHRRLSVALLGVTGVLYTIPSLALFVLLEPVTGLTVTTAVIGITSYTLLLLTRNVLAGLDGVDPDVVEAARGLGMGPLRVLLQVRLPLALPAVMAGLRIATVSTIALTTVAVVVSAGGLGRLLFAGLVNNFYHAEIATATILCVLLAAVADVLLLGLERLLTPWARRRT